MIRERHLVVTALDPRQLPPARNLQTYLKSLEAELSMYAVAAGPESSVPSPSVEYFYIRSRAIPWALVRKPFAIMEFWTRCVALAVRHRRGFVWMLGDSAIALTPIFRLFGWTTVAWFFEYYSEDGPRPERLVAKLSHWAAKWCSLMIAPTPVRISLHRTAIGRDVRAACIPNSPLSSAPSASRSPEEGCLPLKVVYTGSIGTAHSLRPLIASVASMRGRAHLTICGDDSTPEGNRLKALVLQLGGEPYVTFKGHVPYEALYGELIAADIGYVVYRPESANEVFSAPSKLAEYLRAGLAVIVDDNCYLAEDIGTSGAGAIVPTSVDEAALRATLENFIQSPEVLAVAKRAAYEIFCTKLSFERGVDFVLSTVEVDRGCHS